jgi:hypothetical protein
MRRYSGSPVSRRGRGAVAPAAAFVAAAWLAAAATPAGATVTATTSGATLVSAMAAPQQVFPLANLALPPSGTPAGTSTSVLPPFPYASPYAVLSTGDATVSDQPGKSTSADDGGTPAPTGGHGDSNYDTTILSLGRVSVPTGMTCLSFNFRFLSADYPSGLTSPYNDAFIAEVAPNSSGQSQWLAMGTTIQKLDQDFAVTSDGKPITVKSTGVATMSPAEAAGTPYAAATAPLRAEVPVTPTDILALFFSIFDHGNATGDSAVFIDQLGFTNATCSKGVVSLGPAIAITAPSVAATVENLTPTLTGTANGAGAVTVRIYSGPNAAGAPVQTLPASRTGNTWSATSGQLAPGQYTAQATQASAQGDGVSPPLTFTVAAPRAAPPATGGGSSSQQGSGDRDNDGIPDDQDASDGSLPPVPGKTFDARVVSGDVFIKYPPGTGPRAAAKPPKGFVALKGAANVPMGARLDTRRGRVAVTSAHDTSGSAAQTADFYDGIFAVRQSTPKAKPAQPKVLITDLVLVGEPPRSECAPIKGASAAAAKKKKRGGKSVLGGLWGNGKGRFRTDGKYSSATVRGTIWLTQDRCDGTLTTVKRGTVSVRDFKRRRTVSVKAGHSYLARAASKAKRAR